MSKSPDLTQDEVNAVLGVTDPTVKITRNEPHMDILTEIRRIDSGTRIQDGGDVIAEDLSSNPTKTS